MFSWPFMMDSSCVESDRVGISGVVLTGKTMVLDNINMRVIEVLF